MDNNENYVSNMPEQFRAEETRALGAHVAKVFGIMFAGLAVTAVTAVFCASSGLLVRMGAFVYVLMIAQFILVIALSASIQKMSYAAALNTFLAYAVLNGITLSFIFYVYDIGLIGVALAVTAVTFGVMSVYGYVTKADLTGFGSLALMFLVGGIIITLVNLFIRSEAIDFLVSFVMLAVFIGLVAYDTQKIKHYFYAAQGNPEMQRKTGIFGALSLYLDFINIFLRLLRVLGRRR